MEDNVIFVKRVSYGKDSTPEQDREYVMIDSDGPVGTIDEWIEQGFKPIIQVGGVN